MIVVPRSGLVAIYREARAYLEEHGVGASVDFGWKARRRNTNMGARPGSLGGYRVVVVPSDPDSGKAGPIGLEVKPGPVDILNDAGVVVGHVRPLREWRRAFAVIIWAAGSEADEEQLVEETETLLEWVVRAFQASAGGMVTWGEPGWTPTPAELTNGRELVLPGVLRTVIYDTPTETARPTPEITSAFTQPQPPA